MKNLFILLRKHFIYKFRPKWTGKNPEVSRIQNWNEHLVQNFTRTEEKKSCTDSGHLKCLETFSFPVSSYCYTTLFVFIPISLHCKYTISLYTVLLFPSLFGPMMFQLNVLCFVNPLSICNFKKKLLHNS